MLSFYFAHFFTSAYDDSDFSVKYVRDANGNEFQVNG